MFTLLVVELGYSYNTPTTETIETRPDGSTYTVLTNYVGEVILTDLEDSSSNHWYSYNEYGTSGYNDAQVILQAAPSAIIGYSYAPTFSVSLNTASGLFYEYVYGSSTTAPTTTDGSVAGGNVLGYEQCEELLHGSVWPALSSLMESSRSRLSLGEPVVPYV